ETTCGVKLCTVLVVLDTPFKLSTAVTRQKRSMSSGRSAVGTNTVSLTPSATFPVARSVVNADEFATSNRYVMAPAGPVRLTFATRKPGRGDVFCPVSGAIGVGVPSVTAAPTLNL